MENLSKEKSKKKEMKTSELQGIIREVSGAAERRRDAMAGERPWQRAGRWSLRTLSSRGDET